MKNQFKIAYEMIENLRMVEFKNEMDKIDQLYKLPSELAKNNVKHDIVAKDAIDRAIKGLNLNKNPIIQSKDLFKEFKKERNQKIVLSLVESNIRFFYGEFKKYDSRNGNYVSIDNIRIKKEIKEISIIPMNTFEINEIQEQLKIESNIDENQINNHKHLNLINCNNCMIEIKSNKIITYPHSPEYLSTSSLGVAYNPDSKCELWLDFLCQTFGSYGEEKYKAIELLREIIGYMLVPGNSYQKFFCFYGLPRSGKSIVGTIISKILGEDNVSNIEFEALGKDTNRASLASKLLNVSGELKRGEKIDSAIIKSLVGQDRVSARKLYCDPFYFINVAKFLTISNHLPFFNDNSSAIIERLIVLNFETQVPVEKRDTKLIFKLEKEIDGIFNWALEGLMNLNKRGRFEELEKSLLIKQSIQRMSDSILYWFEEINKNELIFDFDRNKNKKISLKKLYDNYVKFCKNCNIEIEKKIEFKHKLSQMKEIKVYRDTIKNQDYAEIDFE